MISSIALPTPRGCGEYPPRHSNLTWPRSSQVNTNAIANIMSALSSIWGSPDQQAWQRRSPTYTKKILNVCNPQHPHASSTQLYFFWTIYPWMSRREIQTGQGQGTDSTHLRKSPLTSHNISNDNSRIYSNFQSSPSYFNPFF